MVDDPNLRAEIARIRETAKGVRVDYKRNGAEPKWDMVKSKIGGPLAELHDRLTEELARASRKRAWSRWIATRCAQIRRTCAALLRGTRPEPLMPPVAVLFPAGRIGCGRVAAAGGAVLCAVAWSYLRTPAPRLLRLACAALKLLGAAILLACLLDPMWSSERAKPGANVIAVVATIPSA